LNYGAGDFKALAPTHWSLHRELLINAITWLSGSLKLEFNLSEPDNQIPIIDAIALKRILIVLAFGSKQRYAEPYLAYMTQANAKILTVMSSKL